MNGSGSQSILLTVVIRQHECMSVAISPEAEKFLHFLVPFVRTACEELIWAKYLVSLDGKDAELLVQCISVKSQFESLNGYPSLVLSNASNSQSSLQSHFSRIQRSAGMPPCLNLVNTKKGYQSPKQGVKTQDHGQRKVLPSYPQMKFLRRAPLPSISTRTPTPQDGQVFLFELPSSAS
jgi:hypothetical protein